MNEQEAMQVIDALRQDLAELKEKQEALDRKYKYVRCYVVTKDDCEDTCPAVVTTRRLAEKLCKDNNALMYDEGWIWVERKKKGAKA